jgi:plasmid stabilization system protein ParE
MTYRIVYHPEIQNDLLNISKLIADHAGVGVAQKKLGQIRATIEVLRDTPHIGSVRSDIYEGLRAIPAAGKGVIAFTVDNESKTVFLVSVTYAGADWMSGVSIRT